jgi:hypothetical protein
LFIDTIFGIIFFSVGFLIINRNVDILLKNEDNIPEDVKNGQLLFDFVKYKKKSMVDYILPSINMIFGIIFFLSGLTIISDCI